jgi:hypothetical protein
MSVCVINTSSTINEQRTTKPRGPHRQDKQSRPWQHYMYPQWGERAALQGNLRREAGDVLTLLGGAGGAGAPAPPPPPPTSQVIGCDGQQAMVLDAGIAHVSATRHRVRATSRKPADACQTACAPRQCNKGVGTDIAPFTALWAPHVTHLATPKHHILKRGVVEFAQKNSKTSVVTHHIPAHLQWPQMSVQQDDDHFSPPPPPPLSLSPPPPLADAGRCPSMTGRGRSCLLV